MPRASWGAKPAGAVAARRPAGLGGQDRSEVSPLQPDPSTQFFAGGGEFGSKTAAMVATMTACPTPQASARRGLNRLAAPLIEDGPLKTKARSIRIMAPSEHTARCGSANRATERSYTSCLVAGLKQLASAGDRS